MSIHKFSEQEFLNIAKSIVLEECIVRNEEIFTTTSSFKYDHDLSSFDIASVLLAIEQKYNLDMEFVPVNSIDNLQDIYNNFLIAIEHKRKKYLSVKVPEYSLDFDNVFSSIKSIINYQHGNLPTTKLTKDTAMRMDLKLDDVDVSKILVELENRYNHAIPASYGAEEALTLGEFCKICSDTLKKQIPLKTKVDLRDVIKSATDIIANKKDLLTSDICPSSYLKRDLRVKDAADRQEIIMDLEKIYRVAISDKVVYSNAEILSEFCKLCEEEINKKIPLNNRVDTNVTILQKRPNIFKRIKVMYQNIKAR